VISSLIEKDRSSGFIQKINETNYKFNTRGLLFGILIYNLYLIVDSWLVPDIIGTDIFMRLVVVSPLLFLYLPARHFAMKARPDAIAHEVLHSFGCMLVVASLMYIYAHARTTAASEYYMGVATVVMYMNTVHRKPLLLAALGTAGCLAVFIIGMQYVTVTSEEAKVPAILCSIGISLVSLFAAYRIEEIERKDYLASLREKTLLARIQSANAELQQLSNTDQLTGIPNRRGFDAAVEETYRSSGRPRAVILLDVDYFKHYNDAAGHPAGDECLRLIGNALRTALRSDRESQDFVARYGGEEFAVLLDKCSQPDALAVSERLRRTISDLAIAHPARPDARDIVTVSLGIAVSSHRNETIAQALGRADAALYEAKRQGRDRSVLAHEDAEWVVAQLHAVPEPVAETSAERARNKEAGR